MINLDMEAKFNTWFPFFNNFMLDTAYFKKLKQFVHNERILNTIYPEDDKVFRCFELTNIEDLKVVVLGFEPNLDGTSNGLALGLELGKINEEALTKSKIINDAIEADLNILRFSDESLENIAEQGVLLLNTALTSARNLPKNHLIYWRLFIKYTLLELSKKSTGVIYVLLGSAGKSFKKYINPMSNYILEYDHPDNLGPGQKWDCNMFSEINNIIQKNNGKEFCIDWR